MNEQQFKELFERIDKEFHEYVDELKTHDIDYIISKSYETAHIKEMFEYFDCMLYNDDFVGSKFEDIDYAPIKNYKYSLLEHLYDRYMKYDNMWPNFFYWAELGEFLYDELKNI